MSIKMIKKTYILIFNSIQKSVQGGKFDNAFECLEKNYKTYKFQKEHLSGLFILVVCHALYRHLKDLQRIRLCGLPHSSSKKDPSFSLSSKMHFMNCDIFEDSFLGLISGAFT